MELATEKFLAVSRAYLRGSDAHCRQDPRREAPTRACGGPADPAALTGGERALQRCAASGLNTRAR